MSDDVMVSEYPDEAQRNAVCEAQWDENREGIHMPDDVEDNQPDETRDTDAPDVSDNTTPQNMADIGDGRPLTGNVERRNFVVDEIRVLQEGESRKIVGHAAVFNSDSEFMGFVERVAPGAFRSSITRDDVRALFNHDSNFVLGRNRAGTLKLSEDDIGLHVEILPPDTQYAKDLMVSMERGDINQMSFGFITRKDSWDYSTDVAVRTLQEVELFDVSPVTYPAYPDTDVAVRSMEKWQAEHNEEEEEPAFDALDLKRKKLDLLTV
jgi:HK97 family phage prohead protease